MKTITLPCEKGETVLIKKGYYSEEWVEETVKRIIYDTNADTVIVYTDSNKRRVWGVSVKAVEGEK